MPIFKTLFDHFGGVRQMAVSLGEPPSTVQSWKNAGRIPAGKQPLVLARAAVLGIPIAAIDVIFPLGTPGPSRPDDAGDVMEVIGASSGMADPISGEAA